MGTMARKGLAATGVVLTLGGCFYPQEADPFAGLGEGDVVARITGVPPGTSAEVGPLVGSRGRLRNSAVVRTSSAAGRIVFRNLPAGDHRLTFFYDPNRDGIPELARVSEAPITVRSRAGQERRVTLSLGDVELLPPGRVVGSVAAEGAVPFGAMAVAVEDVERTVTPDSNGAFVFPGLGQGSWRIMAAGGGRISNVVEVAVVADAAFTLSQPLVLGPVGTGTVTVDLKEFPAGGSTLTPGTTSQGLSVPVTVELLREEGGAVAPVTCTPVNGMAGTGCSGVFSADQAIFNDVPHGLYVVRASGEGYLPLAVRLVPVGQGDNALQLLMDPQPVTTEGQCVDQDGDTLCAMPVDALTCASSNACAATCRQRTAQTLDDPCGALDCDDDSDGQADVVEASGCCVANRPGPCACGVSGDNPDPTSCVGDATRADVDLDGVCDAYDRQRGADPCGSSATDGGVVQDASVDFADGSVPVRDASVDVPDAGVDVVVTLSPSTSVLTGDTVQAQAVSLLGGEAVFDWAISPPAWDTAAPGPSATRDYTLPTRPGNYTVTATVMRGGVPVRGSANVVVRPALLPVLTAVAVAAGTTHTLLILPNDVVVSLGGQMTNSPRYIHGDGNALQQPSEAEMPALVQGAAGRGVLRASKVCAGNEFSVAISKSASGMDDRVVAWGKSAALGGGMNATATRIPQFVNEPQTALPILARDIACGDDHALALSVDGTTIYTWGGNDQSQLGIGAQSNSFEVHELRPGGASVVFTRVFAAGRVSAAQTSGGTLYVWGDGDPGHSGRVVDRLDTPTVLQQGIWPATHSLQQFAMGPRDVLAVLTDGSSERFGGWGNNAALGATTITTFQDITGSSVMPANVTLLASGDGVGVVASGGMLFSFGDPAKAMFLGRDVGGAPSNLPAPVTTAGGQVPSNVLAASVGPNHTVLLNSGVPLGFGSNAARQLGPPVQGLWPRAQPIPQLNCGQTLLDTQEDCDDGAYESGDGCTPTCRMEGQCDLTPGAAPGPDVIQVPNNCATFRVTRSLAAGEAPDFYRVHLRPGVYLVSLRGNDGVGGPDGCDVQADVRLFPTAPAVLPDVSQACPGVAGEQCQMFTGGGMCDLASFSVLTEADQLWSVSAGGMDPAYRMVVSRVTF